MTTEIRIEMLKTASKYGATVLIGFSISFVSLLRSSVEDSVDSHINNLLDDSVSHYVDEKVDEINSNSSFVRSDMRETIFTVSEKCKKDMSSLRTYQSENAYKFCNSEDFSSRLDESTRIECKKIMKNNCVY